MTREWELVRGFGDCVWSLDGGSYPPEIWCLTSMDHGEKRERERERERERVD
jgi:hypothetical protein